MAPPVLVLTVMAAEDLKNVATFGKMDLFAVAWIDPYMKQATRILRKTGKNPVWNDTLTLPLENWSRQSVDAVLTVQILSESSMGDKVVGTGRLPLQEILRISPPEGEEPALVTLQLQRPSGRAQGILRLSMQLTGDALLSRSAGQPSYAVDKKEDQDPVLGIPVSSYPAVPYYDHGTTSTGYPSLSSGEPRNGSGSEMVPYAYPPAYQGYYPGNSVAFPNTYPYVQPPRPQSRRNGSLLLGLIGGALGGLILGDILT